MKVPAVSADGVSKATKIMRAGALKKNSLLRTIESLHAKANQNPNLAALTFWSELEKRSWVQTLLPPV